VWEHLPEEVQSAVIGKKLPLIIVIDAGRVAREAGMGGRINTIMQTCFFAISVFCRGRGDRTDQRIDQKNLWQER